MNKLRKEVLNVKEGQLFTFVGNNEFFTNGRPDYRVESIDYDNGSQTTNVEFIDDQGQLHLVSDDFLAKNFTPTSIPKNFRHV